MLDVEKIKLGVTETISTSVTPEMTAVSVKSGTLPVLATPVLASLMESVAYKSVERYLTKDESTVGSHIDLFHKKPTGVGQTIQCTSVLTSIDGRCLQFDIIACDEIEEIAKARHERYIINTEKFMAKIKTKN